MTREHKLALILGFSVVLVVGVLISDHFSRATIAQLEDLTADTGAVSTVLDAPNETQSLERAHAAGPAASTVLPGGYSFIGEPDSPTFADRPVFESSSEALLNEIQKTWYATQHVASKAQGSLLAQTRNAVPVVALDGGVTGPTAALPEPTRVLTPASHGVWGDEALPTKTHRVAEDESLWSIAEQHYGDGALYTKLAAFNSDRVDDDHTIHVGDVLRIPPRHGLTGERPTSHQTTRTATIARTYTVRDGDTLGEIAQRLLGSSKRWPEIVKLNGIDDPDVVPVGTMLKLPASH